MQLYFGLARILLFKSCKYGKAPKVLASRLITIFVGKEQNERKGQTRLRRPAFSHGHWLESHFSLGHQSIISFC
jgi:hypothetical protein